ncbi:MAG: response regulator [Ruminococcus sp.]|nr:response regulator [Ruminococcus sp.]
MTILSKKKYDKPVVLIVDDSDSNRELLSDILEDDYDIIEAPDGTDAIRIIEEEKSNISIVLLDINMQVMDGYGVLSFMNEKKWIEDIPVVIISSERTSPYIHRGYEMGATDFIIRPFDVVVVKNRVANTIKLYLNQKELRKQVRKQIKEKEKTSNLMINILSHIVEFRNGESGMHVLHVQLFTHILLQELIKLDKDKKYNLNHDDISLISKASALHDIGKIAIPDEILNKPGRLTDEEFAIMKQHSMEGAKMLDALETYKDEPLVKVSYEICRWHHERFDGRGYPDGLKGDEIPISAQIVALADVYDALTSERVYKKAFSHEKAVAMILNNECGVFNPIIMECLKNASDEILRRIVEDDMTMEIN